MHTQSIQIVLLVLDTRYELQCSFVISSPNCTTVYVQYSTESANSHAIYGACEVVHFQYNYILIGVQCVNLGVGILKLRDMGYIAITTTRTRRTQH